MGFWWDFGGVLVGFWWCFGGMCCAILLLSGHRFDGIRALCGHQVGVMLGGMLPPRVLVFFHRIRVVFGTCAPLYGLLVRCRQISLVRLGCGCIAVNWVGYSDFGLLLGPRKRPMGEFRRLLMANREKPSVRARQFIVEKSKCG